MMLRNGGGGSHGDVMMTSLVEEKFVNKRNWKYTSYYRVTGALELEQRIDNVVTILHRRN